MVGGFKVDKGSRRFRNAPPDRNDEHFQQHMGASSRHQGWVWQGAQCTQFSRMISLRSTLPEVFLSSDTLWWFGRGDDTVGNPHRAQIYQFELFGFFLNIIEIRQYILYWAFRAKGISISSILPPGVHIYFSVIVIVITNMCISLSLYIYIYTYILHNIYTYYIISYCISLLHIWMSRLRLATQVFAKKISTEINTAPRHRLSINVIVSTVIYMYIHMCVYIYIYIHKYIHMFRGNCLSNATCLTRVFFTCGEYFGKINQPY